MKKKKKGKKRKGKERRKEEKGELTAFSTNDGHIFIIIPAPPFPFPFPDPDPGTGTTDMQRSWPSGWKGRVSSIAGMVSFGDNNPPNKADVMVSILVLLFKQGDSQIYGIQIKRPEWYRVVESSEW